MSEERLQEIKDSIELQYTIAKAKNVDNALLFTNEEEELVEEIERLKQRIDKAIEELERLSKLYEDNYTISDKAKDIIEILKGSDK